MMEYIKFWLAQVVAEFFIVIAIVSVMALGVICIEVFKWVKGMK